MTIGIEKQVLIVRDTEVTNSSKPDDKGTP